MVEWVCKKFEELKPGELYSILQLRNEVFVVEQNCVYQDADNKDLLSWHLMGWQDEKLIAYTRLIPSSVVNNKVSIGRVVTSPSVRKKGIGKELMEISIEKTKQLFGNTPVLIGAQLYLKKFYESLGFQQSSAIYLEDGIEHIEMILS